MDDSFVTISGLAQLQQLSVLLEAFHKEYNNNQNNIFKDQTTKTSSVISIGNKSVGKRKKRSTIQKEKVKKKKKKSKKKNTVKNIPTQNLRQKEKSLHIEEQITSLSQEKGEEHTTEKRSLSKPIFEIQKYDEGYDKKFVHSLSEESSESLFSESKKLEAVRKLARAEIALARIHMIMKKPYKPVIPSSLRNRRQSIKQMLSNSTFYEIISKWPVEIQRAFLSSNDEEYFKYFQPLGSMLSRPYMSLNALERVYNTPMAMDSLTNGDILHVPFTEGERIVAHNIMHQVEESCGDSKVASSIAASLPGRTSKDCLRYMEDIVKNIQRSEQVVLFDKKKRNNASIADKKQHNTNKRKGTSSGLSSEVSDTSSILPPALLVSLQT